jgi:uncharacterized membrane protein
VKGLLVMSIVLLAIIVPSLAARSQDPRRGLWRALTLFAIAAAIYVGYLIFVHPFVFVPHWP